jgi:soluble lytic murein transglycosylase
LGGIIFAVIKRLAVILIIVIGLFALYNNIVWFMKYVYPLKYRDAIVRYSVQYEIDPYLTAAVIKVESDFSPEVTSSKGAVGLMQLMPETAAWSAGKMGLRDFKTDYLTDPEINIKIGTWYLATLQKEFDDDLTLILAAYNGGRGNVSNWIKSGQLSGAKEDNIPFNETRKFVMKVKKAYRWYKKLYEL